MTPDEARQAQRDGAYVQFRLDGAEFLGTIHQLDHHEAEVDIVGYRNHADAEWRLRVMPRRWVPVEKLEQHRTRWTTAQNQVPEDSDQAVRLFGTGDTIETDEGPGELVGVQFNAAKYHDGWELDPPSLVVELESGDVIHTCLCSIELPNTVKGTKLIHQEFDRLWPTKDDEVPPDANMLIPEGDEPVREGTERNAVMRSRRYAEEESGYQGWKNYETWAVALWLDNDEGSYRYWREEIEMMREELSDEPEYGDARTDLQIALADRLKDEVEEGNPMADAPASVYSDLMSAAISEVDFYEIAKSMLEE